MNYRTHPVGEPQQAPHGIWIDMPNGTRVCVQVDSRGRLQVEVEGQAGISMIPVNSGTIAIVTT